VTLVELKLPRGADILFNNLYRDPTPLYMRDELLAIRLPGGRVIDVDWHPDFDPQGSYIVSVFSNDDEKAEYEYESSNIEDVIETVEAKAVELVSHRIPSI
jgi:hypothetical protein